MTLEELLSNNLDDNQRLCDNGQTILDWQYKYPGLIKYECNNLGQAVFLLYKEYKINWFSTVGEVLKQITS